MAAATPESGTGTTRSASAGDSRGRKRARISRDSPPPAAENQGIGTREIDMLEDTLGTGLLRSVALARHAFGADDHHLAGIDLVQVDRADQVEGAGLGGEDVALAAAGDFHFADG